MMLAVLLDASYTLHCAHARLTIVSLQVLSLLLLTQCGADERSERAVAIEDVSNHHKPNRHRVRRSDNAIQRVHWRGNVANQRLLLSLIG
jgi:hypothetical protein